MPASPSAMPAQTPARGRTPPGRAQSSSAIHIGVDGDEQGGDAGRDALLGPRHEPVAADEQQRARDGRRPPLRAVSGAAPRARLHPNRSEPAATKRAPAIVNGGSVSTAKRIARYVEPQMR